MNYDLLVSLYRHSSSCFHCKYFNKWFHNLLFTMYFNLEQRLPLSILSGAIIFCSLPIVKCPIFYWTIHCLTFIASECLSHSLLTNLCIVHPACDFTQQGQLDKSGFHGNTETLILEPNTFNLNIPVCQTKQFRQYKVILGYNLLSKDASHSVV